MYMQLIQISTKDRITLSYILPVYTSNQHKYSLIECLILRTFKHVLFVVVSHFTILIHLFSCKAFRFKRDTTVQNWCSYDDYSDGFEFSPFQEKVSRYTLLYDIHHRPITNQVSLMLSLANVDLKCHQYVQGNKSLVHYFVNSQNIIL